MIREEITKIIKQAVKKAELVSIDDDIYIEHPENSAFGDFSTNIALRISKTQKKSPRDTAEKIVSSLKDHTRGYIRAIDIKDPGFINIFLESSVWHDELNVIRVDGDRYGSLEIGQHSKINIEFFSANPTGEPHIGNGRGAFYGDVLSNVLEKAGFRVTREYYIQDAKESNQIRELGKTIHGEGEAYKTPYLDKKQRALTESGFKMVDIGETGYVIAREMQKDIRSFIEEKLGIRFDVWASENDLYERKETENMFRLLKEKDLVYEREGAWWAKSSQFGAPEDRVVKRSDGTPTYLLPDLAYHKDKFTRGFNHVVNIWGADHQGHIKDMQALLEALWPEKTVEFLLTQMVHIKGGMKLSKRKGEIITLEWLIDEVGLDVARFFYLIKSIDTQMEFDVDLAREKSEKNPVYYVQYAHARIASILRNAGGELKNSGNTNLGVLSHPSELALMKELAKFPEIVEDTARDYQIQRIPHYSLKLADLFHRFYHDCRVLGEDRDITVARLALVHATKIVIKNTLQLLGISAPEKM